MTNTETARYNIISRRDGEVLGYVIGRNAARKAVRDWQDYSRGNIGYRAA